MGDALCTIRVTLGAWLPDSAWWEVRHTETDQRWRVLPVAHPARSSPSDYQRAAAIIRRMIS